jgi:hypothetical protein
MTVKIIIFWIVRTYTELNNVTTQKIVLLKGTRLKKRQQKHQKLSSSDLNASLRYY